MPFIPQNILNGNLDSLPLTPFTVEHALALVGQTPLGSSTGCEPQQLYLSPHYGDTHRMDPILNTDLLGIWPVHCSYMGTWSETQ